MFFPTKAVAMNEAEQDDKSIENRLPVKNRQLTGG